MLLKHQISKYQITQCHPRSWHCRSCEYAFTLFEHAGTWFTCSPVGWKAEFTCRVVIYRDVLPVWSIFVYQGHSTYRLHCGSDYLLL